MQAVDARIRRRTLARFAGGVSLVSCLVLATAAAPALAGPRDGRLDRAEREQLRDELGRQSRVERVRQNGGADVGWSRSEDRRQGGRPERPERAERYRMDPQEREQLRRMLREHRRERRE